MLRLAIRLSEIGVGDYWEDADQYLRNHLVEHQMVDRKLMEEISASGGHYKIDPVMDEANNIIDRNIGAFASGTDPTWLYGWWTMCYNANCAVGLYKGWESITRRKVHMRIPRMADKKAVECWVNGKRRVPE